MTLDATDRRILKATASGLPLTAHPMDVVRTAVSVIGAQQLERLAAPLAKNGYGQYLLKLAKRGVVR